MAAPDTLDLTAILESILFVAAEPLEVAVLAGVVGEDEEIVRQALDRLAEDYQKRGVRIQHAGDAVQLVTAPETSEYVERYLGVEGRSRLSTGALETLAIVAYRQPLTRGAIEEIRGVSCDSVLATLRARGLIDEVGRASTVGRPYLYGTTFRFLEYFGLERPEDLPEIKELQVVAD